MLGFLGDLLGLNAGQATMNAANQNKSVLGDYLNNALGAINTGTTGAQGYLDKAQGLYGNLADLGQKGANLYADAMGVNGSAGTQRAQDAFTTSPGYQFGLDQGLQALDRSNAARGQFQGGGAGLDEMKYATGYADQNYNNWLNGLSGYNQMLGTATAGQAGELGSLGQLMSQSGGAKANIYGDYAGGLTSANNQYAQGKEANTAGLAGLGSTILGGLGKMLGGGFF